MSVSELGVQTDFGLPQINTDSTVTSNMILARNSRKELTVQQIRLLRDKDARTLLDCMGPLANAKP